MTLVCFAAAKSGVCFRLFSRNHARTWRGTESAGIMQPLDWAVCTSTVQTRPPTVTELAACFCCSKQTMYAQQRPDSKKAVQTQTSTGLLHLSTNILWTDDQNSGETKHIIYWRWGIMIKPDSFHRNGHWDERCWHKPLLLGSPVSPVLLSPCSKSNSAIPCPGMCSSTGHAEISA